MSLTSNKISSKNKNAFKRSRLTHAVALALVASSATSTNLYAQQSNDDTADTEVITVTATKRSESIQEVALAVTALNTEFMEDFRLTDVKDVINYTPGVTGNSADSFLDLISIRGVRTDDYGAGGDLSIGVFKNDLYEGRTGVAVSSLFDMDRAEVARGPQGFLFGRNTIGGAISTHTRRAEIDSTDKYINADLGEYSRLRIDTAFNVPINDNFAMRFAGLYHAENSYITNLNEAQPIPDTDTIALRWSTTFEGDFANIYSMVEYENRKRPGTIYRAVKEGEIYDAFTDIWGELDIPDDPFTTNTESRFGFKDDTEALNIQVRLEKELDFADLTVSAGYKDHTYDYSEDYDGSPFENGSYLALQDGDYSQIEARLNSNIEGDLSWYAGVSFYQEDFDFEVDTLLNQDMMCQYAGQYFNYYYNYNTADIATCTELASVINYYFGSSYAWEQRLVNEEYIVGASNDGWAGYINIDYQITDSINAEFGIRRSTDNKELSNQFFTDVELDGFFWSFYNYGVTTAEPILADESWSDTSIRALARWRPDDDTMFYVSYTEGYKSGGFSTLGLESRDGSEAFGIFDATNDDFVIPTFGPESVDSYEFGYKDSWTKNTDVSFTYFYYEYAGLQVVAPDPESGGTIVRNVGNVDAQGIEFAMNTTLGEHWELYFVYSWLDSEATGIQDQCFFSGPDFDLFSPGAGDNDACEGRKLFWAPEHSGAFVINGYFPVDNGEIYTSLDAWYESERSSTFDFIPSTTQEDIYIMSARLGYESEDEWFVEAYVENLTDQVVYDYAYDLAGFEYMPVISAWWTPYKPRNFGVRFGYYWE